MTTLQNTISKMALFILTGTLLLSGCGKIADTADKQANVATEAHKETPEPEQWEAPYTEFLDDLQEKVQSDSESVYSYAIKDLDNNGIPELLVKKNGTLSAYTYENQAVKHLGDSDEYGGTGRYLSSGDDEYSGMIIFCVYAGLEHYEYMTIKDNQLVTEELWNEDYSGISKELGKDRERIEELSSDKQLIALSKKAYAGNQDIEFKIFHPKEALEEE